MKGAGKRYVPGARLPTQTMPCLAAIIPRGAGSRNAGTSCNQQRGRVNGRGALRFAQSDIQPERPRTVRPYRGNHRTPTAWVPCGCHRARTHRQYRGHSRRAKLRPALGRSRCSRPGRQTAGRVERSLTAARRHQQLTDEATEFRRKRGHSGPNHEPHDTDKGIEHVARVRVRQLLPRFHSDFCYRGVRDLLVLGKVIR